MSDHAIWAFLADPEDFGWDQLVSQGTAVWDGIRNAQAQRNLAKCQVGDVVMIYHTAPDKALIGLATVTSQPRPDPAAPDRLVVDVRPERAFARPIPLAELKADPLLSNMGFVRMPRVAVQPVTSEQLQRVQELGKG